MEAGGFRFFRGKQDAHRRVLSLMRSVPLQVGQLHGLRPGLFSPRANRFAA
jgi:hypothetical protein